MPGYEPLGPTVRRTSREPGARVSGAPAVLVTGDQGRIALTTVRSLGAAGYDAVLTVSEGRSLAAASRYCVRTVRVPHVSSTGYAEAVRDELEKHPYLTCLPVSDSALLK